MKSLRVEREGEVCVITIDRPPVNAMHLEMLQEAGEVISELENDSECRAIVFTGAGKCFSAGLDLKIVPYYDASEQRELIEAIESVVTAIYSFPKPTVAAVNGAALAGGFVLLVCCDYRVGVDESYALGSTEIRVGVPFPVATMEVLKRELAPAVLRRLALTGSHVDPTWALDWRILDELLPRRQLMPRAIDVASELSKYVPGAYRAIKAQLKEEIVTKIEQSVAEGDPLLGGWMTEESKKAAAKILGLSS